MNNWTFTKIYAFFLAFVQSCTFADLLDEELEEELSKFLLRALADFRFPQVGLDFEPVYDEEDDQKIVDYRFTDEGFSQKEVNVLLAYMRKYFFEWMVAREKNFEQQYYDSDTKTHSLGNLVQQMNSAYKAAIKEANDINYDYTRSDDKRKARIGAVNE